MNIIVKKKEVMPVRSNLKKALSLILIVLVFLSSCAYRSHSATDLLFEALEELEDCPPYTVYYSSAPSYSESSMTTETAELLYRDKGMLSYAESFACALGDDDSVWEIHIFVALSASDTGFIENALDKRLDMLQKREINIYDPDVYEKRIEDAKVIRNGKVVCLIVCDENAKLLKMIKRL